MLHPMAQTDRELRQEGRRFKRSGWSFVAIGAVGALIGLALILIGSGTDTVKAIGVWVAALSAAPLLVGLVLLGTALVSAWAGRRKPFA